MTRGVRPKPTESTCIVLGAGFSKSADIPLQAEFSELLVSAEFAGELNLAITDVIRNFLRVAFGWKQGQPFPALEDVFTCIDLSAGTGHNLGIRKFTPKYLRAVRRMMIHRIFSILDSRFSSSPDIDRLLRHFCQPGRARCAFVVLNWDIALEKHIGQIFPDAAIDYRCYCFDWNTLQPSPIGDGIPICKIHGSSNWAYCENCKSLFFDLDEKLPLRAKAGLVKSDFSLVDSKFTDSRFDKALATPAERRNCKFCDFPVSSHIATFSYRKSFRTHAYPSVWYHAEKLLSESSRWVFIGYSLPEADYELKHLLKAAHLRMLHRNSGEKRKVEVVVLNGPVTQRKYEKFFGADYVRCFQNGLNEYVAGLSA